MHRLINKHHGKTAWILGKGPSLDKYTPEDDTVVIGVNDVGNVHECDYIVTTDGYRRISPAKIARFISVPYRTPNGPCFDFDPFDFWFMHLDDVNGIAGATTLTRKQVAQTRWLFTCSSSIQPAIHLAWYLGCDRVKLAGVDGGGGYAGGFDTARQNTDDMYAFLWKATYRLLNILYPDKWERLTIS